eukprot:12151994-Alexandrium_andersonii.AAC.1
MEVRKDDGVLTTPDACHFSDVFSPLGMVQQPPQHTCGDPGIPPTKVSEGTSWSSTASRPRSSDSAWAT